jgi:hypothetical protein
VDERRLGAALLTRTAESRHEIGLDSYDRFFPNQDTMPKGGLGNLIARPLQKGPRKLGNSVFVDEAIEAYPDQWRYLSTIQRIPSDLLPGMIHELAPEGNIVGVRFAASVRSRPSQRGCTRVSNARSGVRLLAAQGGNSRNI